MAQSHAPRRSLRHAGQGADCGDRELGPEAVASLTKGVPNLGPRLAVVSAMGETLAHLDTEPIGEWLGQFIAPHGIALSRDIYVAEVANIGQSSLGRNPVTSCVRCKNWYA